MHFEIPDAVDSKSKFYQILSMQLKAIMEGERHPLPNLCNASAVLAATLEDINWVGFYLMIDGELVLGPFQGKPACIRIPVGRGVCGTAAATRQPQRVEDVHAFPGHIACDSASRSEIVIPLIWNDTLLGVLDIDSPSLSRFTPEDQTGLEACAELIAGMLGEELRGTPSP